MNQERNDYDVWLCTTCDHEWVVASLPHNPKCPTCGTGGWWRRFQPGEVYSVVMADVETVPA